MRARPLSLAISFVTLFALAGCDDGGGGGGGQGGTGAQGGQGGTGAQGGQGGTGAQGGQGGTGAQGGQGGTGAQGGQGGQGGGKSLTWFTTCGDVVCQGASDDPNIPNCTGETEGTTCPTEQTLCELPADECNVSLVCAADDPKAQGCPISLASAKHDIQYLTDRDRDRIREEVASMPLATWKYNTESPGDKQHLGFIIDDQPPSSAAVRASGERVDLYGYTSMAVAAIQAQNKELEALRREVESLRDELARSKAPACAEQVVSSPAR